MAERHYNQPVLAPAPPQLAIPQGKFFQIDQEYYEPKDVEPSLEDIHSKGRTLLAHGRNVNLKANGFIAPETPLGLESGSLKVNYGSYLYQQKTGYDAFHPANTITPAANMRFQ